ncbi:hypothetical protein CGGC5_v016860 [Colletotrichum fructicola Nara gc5]|uniref:Uncharacterized protein n=1 Tax=Colletotrichum fructicola (strain Nara gc5) TaxID=1213859 RepID=A0A7J6IEN6_COLFN|nr:hypothetical protein CGGC5_v016860 [Colletotrichum fructicola Nara gc5]
MGLGAAKEPLLKGPRGREAPRHRLLQTQQPNRRDHLGWTIFSCAHCPVTDEKQINPLLMFDVNRGTADMATHSRFVSESREQNERRSLEQERNAWFTTLDSNRVQFKEARERIRAAYDRAQQSVRIELANQARFISRQVLPSDVVELPSCYQAGRSASGASHEVAPGSVVVLPSPQVQQACQSTGRDRHHFACPGHETGSTCLVGSTTNAPEGLARQSGRSAAKRRQLSAATVAPKRARLTAQRAEVRTTTIDEVRRHNAAGAKSMIIKFNGLFYIISCDEHGIRFRQRALAEAAKHLQGACHGYPTVTNRLIVQSFGVRVVNCTDALALMNNACVTEVPASRYKPTSRARGCGRRRKFVQYIPRAISGPHSWRTAEEEESL